ncbi:hypothetical protein CgunFtcFv8_010224 [Champsocephalus gunnari]|uniref:Uncharacterized protein n=1 Tax=Champsocephalus gunnari TaxID=52237 RepID=A0AAN8DTG9_CHAGU|nr:hypothetical protein CgunFtcFv8_010224 [Champsocephalus gunnari]
MPPDPNRALGFSQADIVETSDRQPRRGPEPWLKSSIVGKPPAGSPDPSLSLRVAREEMEEVESLSVLPSREHKRRSEERTESSFLFKRLPSNTQD